MTGLFLHLHDDFAVLAMDSLTVTYSEGRRVQHGWAAKFIPLPHLDAILAVTGYMPALLHSASCLIELARFSDFDSSAEVLEEFLRVHHDLCTFPKAAGQPQEHSSTRIYLIGHSIRKARFVANRYDSIDSFKMSSIERSWVSVPPDEGAIKRAIEKFDEVLAAGNGSLDMEELLRLMESGLMDLRTGTEPKDGTPNNIGGPIGVAFLTKRNCHIRTMGPC